MRNLKKFLALVLATLMVVSAAATVSAFDDVAEDNQYAAAIDKLVEYGITNGVDESNFAPDNDVERYQMALFMARALKPGETDWSNGMEIFDDVEGYYGAIAFAYTEGIVTGIGNNLFAPHAGIRYQDALIMALRALGYEVDVTGDPYWLAAYTKASEIGLTKNVAVTKGEKTLTRAETAQVIYNMLKAVPADGGATIEEKNFGVMGTDNYTTFVITATEKQAYSESAKAAKAGYVGIQALVNGIPSGDIVYLPVEVFGFEAAEADDYFGYAYDFVNYDAKTGAFDKVVPGLEPVVAYNKDISDKNASKFKFDGEFYYTADAITGAALKNEIVIFNGGAQGVASRMLITNKDGDIVNQNGEVIAAFAYETLTGAKYYYDGKDANGNNSKVVISEATAIDRYGVIIDNDTYVQYQTLKASDLTGNYQVKFFDDDRDGKFERAIYTPVYVTVYNNPDNGKQTTPGPWMTDKEDDRKGVTYSDTTLTKGDVFTYTYNAQTKVVNVLEVLDPQYDTLKKINTTGLKDSIVKLTIGDTEYTVGNTTLESKGLTGAKLMTTSEAPAKFDDVIKNAKIGYVDYTKLTAGSPIRYIAIGNYIIYAETYDIEETFEYVVLKEITSYDSDAVYVDLYKNGKLFTDVAVSVINKQVISELNVFQYSKLLGNQDLFAAGNVFRAVPAENGSYQLSEALDLTDNNKAASLKAFKLVEFTTSTKPTIVFDDGIADMKIGDDGKTTPILDRDDIIRTSSNTVFYFINKSTKAITTYVGMPDNSSINLAKADVYLDNIGFGGDVKGKASIVLVYYTNASDIKGFGVANVEYDTVYIFGDNTKNLNSYTYASASDLGLVGSEYAGKYYYKYSVTGINMTDGSKVSEIYYDKALKAGQFVTISVDGVVINTGVTVESKDLKADDFTQNRYYKITGIANGNGTDNKITTVILTDSSSYDTKKTDEPAKVLTDSKTYTVYYINDFEDGSFVGVVFPKTNDKPTDPVAKGVANATYSWNNNTYGAIYTADEGKATGAIKLYNDKATIGENVYNDIIDSWKNAVKDTAYNVKIEKLKGDTFVTDYSNTAVAAEYADGVLTVSGFNVKNQPYVPVELEAATFRITISFSIDVNGTAAPVAVTYIANVD